MKSWSLMLAALWRYRGFVLSSVWREFSGRYRESLLGVLWSIAQPLAMILIFILVFQGLVRPTMTGHGQDPYAFTIYLCAGVISWNLFAEMLARMTRVFIDHGNLIKKSNFPRICLPTIVALSTTLQFVIVLALYLVYLIVIGHWPGWALLGVVPLLALQLAFTLALGVLLGTMNVFLRDVGQLVAVVLQFWFWLTPIVYTPEALPESLRRWLPLNPVQPLVAGYQRIFLDQSLPDFHSLLPLMIGSLLLLWLAARFFVSHVGELVDEL